MGGPPGSYLSRYGRPVNRDGVLNVSVRPFGRESRRSKRAGRPFLSDGDVTSPTSVDFACWVLTAYVELLHGESENRAASSPNRAPDAIPFGYDVPSLCVPGIDGGPDFACPIDGFRPIKCA